MFELAGQVFPVSSAVLDAYIDVEEMVLAWGLEVQAGRGSGHFSRCSPRISIESFRMSKPGEFEDWRELIGTKVSWSEPYDRDGEHHALLYLFDHTPVKSSVLSIDRGSVTDLTTRWQGLSEVNWRSRGIEDVGFSISQDLEFKGIWFGRRSEVECRRLLSNFFDVSLFEFDVTEHSVSIFRPRDRA